MTAVEKALRHIERLRARLKSSRKTGSAAAQPRRKSAKRARYSKIVIIAPEPRVVSKAARHRSRKAYNPPVTHADVSALVETFVPPLESAEAPKVAPAPAQASTADVLWEARTRLKSPSHGVSDHRPGTIDADLRPNVNFTGLTARADGCFVHTAGVILPDGELADDWDDAGRMHAVIAGWETKR